MSQMLTQGKHVVHVVEHGFTKAPSGTMQLFVRFENDDDDFLTWFTNLGEKLDGTFSRKGYEYGCNALRAMGWNPDDHDHDLSLLGSSECLKGAEVEIVVVDEVYDGKTRTSVKYINDLNGSSGWLLEQIRHPVSRLLG